MDRARRKGKTWNAETGGLSYEAAPQTRTGSINTSFTLSTTVDGDRKRFGSINTSFTLTTTVVGSKAGAGQINTSFTLSTTVDGDRKRYGSANTAFTLSTTVTGARTAKGSVNTSFTLSTTVTGAIPPLRSTIDTTFTLSTTVDTGPRLGLFNTDTTLFPPRIGVTVDADLATATHTVISGTSSRTAGSAAALDGDYAYRGLYAFDTTATVPGDFINDARAWVALASWGDFLFQIRRDVGTTYKVRATFITAGASNTFAEGQITLLNDEPRSIGLGVTRDATTGAIKLWRSNDGWVTWEEVLVASSTIVAGALPDAVGNPVSILTGDLQDGPWISVFQAQWGETTDITDVDSVEVAAWNYGANIVTGIGGDFYDDFDQAAKNSWEFGSETSFIYSQRTETSVNVGTTVRVDFTFNAATLNTGTPTAGTEAAFTYDDTPQWQDGPSSNVWSQAISFESRSQFTTIPSRGDDTVPVGGITDSGSGERWRVIVVGMDGTPVTHLDNAQMGAITWSLNEIESFQFTMPTLDPKVADLTTADTEVQVWRGNRLIVWGVIVRAAATASTMEYQCRGLGWYFTKRFVGGPRRNYLFNHSFETTGGWWNERFMPTEPTRPPPASTWDWRITTEQSLKGYPGRSLYLYSTDGNEFGVHSFQFHWETINAVDRPDGITWTASAWVYIPSDEWGFYDANADKIVGERNAAYNWGGESAAFGMHLGRFSTTESQDQDLVPESYPKVYEITVASLSENLPRDEWVRIETQVVQPPPEAGEGPRTDWIQVELHAPLGGVYYDEVSLVRDERLLYEDVAQELILQDIVAHAQDTTLGKSDLNIGFQGPATTPTILRDRRYDWYQRTLISDIISEFSTVWQGVDWSIETTPTDRTFTVHWPQKGTRRLAQALVLGRNIATIRPAYDGESMANRVVVRADTGGTGASREEAIGTNTEGFANGLVLEASFNAAKDSPLDSIEGQVERALRQKRDGTIPVLTTYESVGSTLFGQIQTGDIVNVEASYGGLQVTGTHRIVSITMNPVDETLDIVVNPFDDYRDPGYAQAERIPG